jgi:tetratricopeptide (TPR) repeat protein
VQSAIIVLTGASGAGKTTLLLALDEQRRAGISCVHCDGADGALTVDQWILRAQGDPQVAVAVIDTQIRPQDALETVARLGVRVARVVLVDCDHPQRHDRLRQSRGQPDLANGGMDCWAAYLRGQADALKLPIIETTSASVAESLARLGEIVTEVLREVRGTDDEALTLMDRADRARREDRLPQARRDFLEAVALCRRSGARGELVRALKGLGQIERDLGGGDAALPLHEEAVALCRGHDDPLLLAHTLRHLGDIHQDAGRLDEAAPHYREALALYRAHETPLLHLANAIRPLALLQERLGQRDDAILLWSEARDLYDAVKVREGVAESAAHLERLRLSTGA